MQTRTTLVAAALLVVGALLGWLTAGANQTDLLPQTKKPADQSSVLPRPEPPFQGKIGRTQKDSTPDWSPV